MLWNLIVKLFEKFWKDSKPNQSIKIHVEKTSFDYKYKILSLDIFPLLISIKVAPTQQKLLLAVKNCQQNNHKCHSSARTIFKTLLINIS